MNAANPSGCKPDAFGNARFKVRSTSVADRLRGSPPFLMYGGFRLLGDFSAMVDKRQNILSEIGELEDLLASVPEGNVIDRLSLEWRLKDVLEELATINHVGQDQMMKNH